MSFFSSIVNWLRKESSSPVAASPPAPTATSVPPPVDSPAADATGVSTVSKATQLEGVHIVSQLDDPHSIFYQLESLPRPVEVAFLIAIASNDWAEEERLLGSDWKVYQSAYTAGGPFAKPKVPVLISDWSTGTRTIKGVSGITPEEFAALTPHQKEMIEKKTGCKVK